jgi:hypothetical protein
MEDDRRVPGFGRVEVAPRLPDLGTTDEEAAREARDRYRESGIPALKADELVGRHLDVDERVLGVRAEATMARIDETSKAAVRDDGPLYITDRRLLHLGQRASSIPLSEIDELAMADNRILVTLAGARGVMLDVDEPRQLRVLIAAAKSASRA